MWGKGPLGERTPRRASSPSITAGCGSGNATVPFSQERALSSEEHPMRRQWRQWRHWRRISFPPLVPPNQMKGARKYGASEARNAAPIPRGTRRQSAKSWRGRSGRTPIAAKRRWRTKMEQGNSLVTSERET